jgi:chromosome segregation ATPase
MITKIEKRRNELVKLDKDLDEKRARTRRELEEETQRLQDVRKDIAEIEEKKNESLGTIAKTDEMQSVLSKLKNEKAELDRLIAEKTKELEKLKIFITRLKNKNPSAPGDKKKDQISF